MVFFPCWRMMAMYAGKNVKSKPADREIGAGKKVEGTLVLTKKNTLDFGDPKAFFLDWIQEFLGKGVSIILISADNPGSSSSSSLSLSLSISFKDCIRGSGKNLKTREDGLSKNIGNLAPLEKWMSTQTPATAEETSFPVAFEWDETMGFPGAFLIKNHHTSQFYIKTLTLHNVPGYGQVHFVCNSWVYPASYYKYDRIFFANKSYLPSQTPKPLIKYREEELIHLRGNGRGMLKEWDRVYDYACYNDLGNPDRGEEHARPVLGGSEEFPYPRRVRTGRKPSKTDKSTESRLPLLSLNIYIPRDERFGQVKFSDFLAYGLKSIGQTMVPEVSSVCDKTFNEFDSFEDATNLYKGGIELPGSVFAKVWDQIPWEFLACGLKLIVQTLVPEIWSICEKTFDEFDSFQDLISLFEGGIELPASVVAKLRDQIPWKFLKELIRTDADGKQFLKLPLPEVLKESKTAWRTDEEFAREMLAGLNPVCIRRLQEFPPASKLDSKVFGNQDSSIRTEHIEKYLNGLTVDQAIEAKKMFILDHHDAIMPYLKRINSTATKTYATRTLLLLQDDGTLKPVAIELSLPHPHGEHHGAFSKVFMPSEDGVEGSIWQLAKAYVAVTDSGCHQLISHWLHTHATMEPFVIATNRQLSVLHPINKLLHPHFKDTMNVNALARQVLINADGVLEKTVFPSKYALEMSSRCYKNWVFTDQALPADLLKRGVAEPDLSCPSKVKLLIEDYPYAVDGLEIWAAIETWVVEYSSIYYKTDEQVRADSELQSWWTEIRTVGHGDRKHEPWWVPMQTRAELIESCTTIIWVGSALHAAINFGQYAYGGYLPNRPTISRSFMPEPGTKEYADLEANPDIAFLKMITPQFESILGVLLIELLSRHSSDEIYLGQRESPNWSEDIEALEAFQRFGMRLVEIEMRITGRNMDKKLKNRAGPVNVPYTLLYPNTSDYSGVGGLTGKGIPNSVSI